MSVRSPDGSYEVFLGPSRRGAADDCRGAIEAVLRQPADLYVASQQVADQGVVDAMADIRSVRGRRARVFVERRYLVESHPVAAGEIWTPTGVREPNRACFSALCRAGIETRADTVGGALQHTNFVLADDGERSLFLFSSANFAPGSIDDHLNWLVLLSGSAVVEPAKQLFHGIWDGDFRDARLHHALTSDNTEVGDLVAGAAGEAVEQALAIIDAAQQRLRFAYFVMSADARVVLALIRAAERGVDVAGIVDADQGFQRWDAVPQLKAGGVDARYYPGALTGASGRMHHKMFAADRSVAHLSTANASHSAEESLELSLSLRARPVAEAIDAEIIRLGANASKQPIALI